MINEIRITFTHADGERHQAIVTLEHGYHQWGADVSHLGDALPFVEALENIMQGVDP